MIRIKSIDRVTYTMGQTVHYTRRRIISSRFFIYGVEATSRSNVLHPRARYENVLSIERMTYFYTLTTQTIQLTDRCVIFTYLYKLHSYNIN